MGAWLVGLSWTTVARAAPFELTWSAPESCPSRDEMVVATRARLGESDERERPTSAPELFVRGAVSPEKGGYVVSFVVADAAGAEVGEREVHVQGRSCRAIEEPAALVLATMISVVRSSTPGESATPPPPETHEGRESVSPSPPLATPPASQSVAAPSRAEPGSTAASPPRSSSPPVPSRRALALAGVGSAGVLPTAGLGAALRTSYMARSRFLLGFESGFEVGAWVRAGRGEVGFQLVSASLLAGYRVLRAGNVELIPLAAVRGGVLRTLPSGFQLVKAEARPMALVGLGALVRVELLPNVYAEALPQAEVVLIRDVFQASEARTTYFLHQPSLVGARLTLGLGYEFP